MAKNYPTKEKEFSQLNDMYPSATFNRLMGF